ncbi:MAG: mannose-1-phosphate guanylyltransferase [Desulfobacula sp. GWF2_41_7]|nr:MAG: mannose-1-phosphate guanylyltransferase [Desulfobacula sp. GWF2_41_7]
MKALLLSAGLGTRLRPLTDKIPKCLAPIHGKPLMAYWLEMLTRAGIDHILVNLHYLPDKVRAFLSSSSLGSFVTTVYEEKLLGTGGTLLKNRDFFGNESVFMAHADNFSVFDMDSFLQEHLSRPARCDITMMTFRTETPESCGILELDSENVVCGFHEKQKQNFGNLANGAVYILEPSVIDFMENLGKEQIDFSTEVIPHYLGRIYTVENTWYHRDIGTMENYLKAEEDFLKML